MPKYSYIFEIFYSKLYLIILALLVFIPLYPKFPFLNLSETYVAIRLEDLIIAFIVLTWTLFNLSHLKHFFSQTIFKAILLFWFVGLLSVLSGVFVNHSVNFSPGFFHWMRRVEYMSLFIVASTVFSTEKLTKKAVYISALTLVVVILYGFGQIWLNFPVISTTNREYSKGLILYLTDSTRVNSTFAGHYDLAIYLSVILMFISSLFFYYKKILSKILIAVLGVFSITLLSFTAARLSFVSSFLGLAIIFWLHGKKLLLIGLVVLALGLLAFIPELRHRLVATATVNLLGGGGAKYNPPPNKVTIYTPINHIPQASKEALLKQASKEATITSPLNGPIAKDTAPGEPINTTELGVYRSLGIRLNVEWPRAINAFYKNPLLGTGYSSISLATDNDFLRSLGETGILGTLSLGLIFFIFIKKVLKYIQNSSGFDKCFAIGVLNSIIMILITASFIDILEASKIAELYWLFLGIAWSHINNYESH